MPYPEGTCLTTTGSFNAIPDNGCASNAPARVSLPQSGLPNTLGTSPGNARLLSVELIISHTYRGDLNVTLTSPSGVTRNLWINRSTTGDNIGNPASCPGGAFIFQDGGTALSTIGNTANSPTGTYAPEQTLAGFTGDPNGTWVLSICDDEAADVGHFRYVRLNFCTVPQITATNSNSPVCSSGTLNLGVTATGTAPLTYAWTGTGTFSPGASSQNPSVTGAATGNYGITVSNVCGSTNTNVPVTVTPAPSATISYTGTPYCSNAGTAAVTRTGTAGGSYSSTAGLSINASTGDVDLGASTPGTYTVTYTIAASGGCALFQTTASITVTANPSATISYAGSPYCSASGPAAVSLTGTTGGVFSATPAGLSINATTGEVDPGASTAGTYTVNYDIAAAGGCGAFNTSTSITITGCTYYSQGNGGVNSAIWATTPVGTPVAVYWNNTSSMVIQSGDTITVNANTTIEDLTTQATSRLIISAGNTLEVHGDALSLAHFTVSPLSGEVELVSATAVNISISGTVNFNDLTVNTVAGTTLTGTMGIFGTLQLNDGAFNASSAT
ncbi:MAG TPA: proprotein convertase P-domain-containing protein, partial [Flavobacteriales bacterium]|nr:proprotein convertase P-domain-containing protein [Flavobacteriales bacterium]